MRVKFIMSCVYESEVDQKLRSDQYCTENFGYSQLFAKWYRKCSTKSASELACLDSYRQEEGDMFSHIVIGDET